MEGNSYNDGTFQVVTDNTVAPESPETKRKSSLLPKILIPVVVLIVIVAVILIVVLNKRDDEPEIDMDDDAFVCDVESVIEEYKPDIMNAKTDEEKFNAYLNRANMLSEYSNLTGCNVKKEALSDLEMAEHFAKTDDERDLIDGAKFYLFGSDSRE